MKDLCRLGTATVTKVLAVNTDQSEPKKPALRHKYHAIRTENDGIKFDSKLEAAFYGKLVQLKQSGHVIQFLRQIPFYLPGGVKYVCDFQVFWSDGGVEFIDTKGVETESFRAKVRIVENLYAPIKITIVKKA